MLDEIGCTASNLKLTAVTPISSSTDDAGRDASESARTLDQNGQELRSELSQLMTSGDSLDVSEAVRTLARDGGNSLAVAHRMIEDPELALRARTTFVPFQLFSLTLTTPTLRFTCNIQRPSNSTNNVHMSR